jgi:hypothetical protein
MRQLLVGGLLAYAPSVLLMAWIFLPAVFKRSRR